MKRKYNNKVDANQPALVELWRKCGAYVTLMSGDPTTGCDVIVSWQGRNEFVEIKDGDKPPSKRKWTEGELQKQEDLGRVGCKLHVGENEEQAIELLNYMASSQSTPQAQRITLKQSETVSVAFGGEN